MHPNDIAIRSAQRYLRTRTSEDLAVAERNLRAALAGTGDAAEHARWQSILGAMLRERALRDNDMTVLDEAVRQGESGLRATAHANPAWPARASNLAMSLRTRARSGTDVQAAVDLLRRAVASAQPADPERGSASALTSGCACARYSSTPVAQRTWTRRSSA